jgi:hypothetical protein
MVISIPPLIAVNEIDAETGPSLSEPDPVYVIEPARAYPPGTMHPRVTSMNVHRSRFDSLTTSAWLPPEQTDDCVRALAFLAVPKTFRLKVALIDRCGAMA